MDATPGKRRDRYDVSGNVEAEYLDADCTVLANKLGIFDLLAAQTGRPLLAYDQTAEGQRRYVDAAKAAIKRDYAHMIEVIRLALWQAGK